MQDCRANPPDDSNRYVGREKAARILWRRMGFKMIEDDGAYYAILWTGTD